jgi:hypothetical protein
MGISVVRVSIVVAALALGLGACSESTQPAAGPRTFADVEGLWISDYQRLVTHESPSQVYDSRNIPSCSNASQPPPSCIIRPGYLRLDSVDVGMYSFEDSLFHPFLAGPAYIVDDSLYLGPSTINCCGPAARYWFSTTSKTLHLKRERTIFDGDVPSFGFNVPPGGFVQATEDDWYHR